MKPNCSLPSIKRLPWMLTPSTSKSVSDSSDCIDCSATKEDMAYYGQGVLLTCTYVYIALFMKVAWIDTA